MKCEMTCVHGDNEQKRKKMTIVVDFVTECDYWDHEKENFDRLIQIVDNYLQKTQMKGWFIDDYFYCVDIVSDVQADIIL